MMKRVFGLAVVLPGSLGRVPPGLPRTEGEAPSQDQLVLAPKLVKLSEYVAPHKPHTKLADVLAKHKGQADWIEPVVDDDNAARRLHFDGARQEDAAPDECRHARVVGHSGRPDPLHDRRPGALRRLEGLSRSGAVPRTCTRWKRLAIGRPCASKSTSRRRRKMYPMDVKPAPLPGFDFVPVRVAGKGTYDEGNKPFVDFNAVVGRHRQDAALRRRRSRGRQHHPRPPASRRRRSPDKGHFHPESAEFWFILLNKIRYNIEGAARLRGRSGRHRLRARRCGSTWPASPAPGRRAASR